MTPRYEVTVQGQRAILLEGRIPENQRDKNLNYYYCRHYEYNMAIPATIEQGCIVVNFWGMLICERPLKLKDGMMGFPTKQYWAIYNG